MHFCIYIYNIRIIKKEVNHNQSKSIKYNQSVKYMGKMLFKYAELKLVRSKK